MFSIWSEDFKDLNRRSFADKVLRDKAFDFAKDTKYDGDRREDALVVYKVLDKKSGIDIKNQNVSNKELREELHKPIIRKLNKKKSTFPIHQWF